MSLVPSLLIILFIVYVAFIGAALYVFVIADPNESPWTEYFSVTLPAQGWTRLQKVVGKRGISIIEFVADRLLLVMYCAIVFGSWSVVFGYIYPWVDRQSHVSPYHKWIGYLVFGACVMSWRLACTTSPGIITPKSLERYQHYPYDNLLFRPHQTTQAAGTVYGDDGITKKIPRIIPKLARSKFDRFKYQRNIARFDHFCGWVYNTIGEENYRFFLLFLAVHSGMCWYGTYVVGQLFYGTLVIDQGLLRVTFVDRNTGVEHPATWWILTQFVFHQYLWESGALLVMSVMALALTVFLMYHCYLTSVNLTTNEAYKWSQVKQWHKKQLKQYQQQQQQQPQQQKHHPLSATSASRPVLTAPPVPKETSRSSSEETAATRPDDAEGEDEDDTHNGEDDSEVEAPLSHPGPMPRNIYNRGLVENWKEVLFPISLRTDRSNLQWKHAPRIAADNAVSTERLVAKPKAM